MKYCMISLPRSRSSVLLETISMFYGIKILGEEIGKIYIRNNEEYLRTLKKMLKKNSRAPKGVIRLHPLQMCSRTREQAKSQKIDAFTLLDFKYYNFEQYNKIYFTYRESIEDNIASNFIAHRFEKYTYKVGSKLITDTTVTFSKSDHWHVIDYIHSIKIMELLKKYLLENSISYQELYYNDIPDYLRRNFPQVKSSHIETNYDYRKMISNYDDITVVYNETLNYINQNEIKNE